MRRARPHLASAGAPDRAVAFAALGAGALFSC